jgi:hypothetical protein
LTETLHNKILTLCSFLTHRAFCFISNESYQLFSRTYAITLKRRPERLAELLSSLQSCVWSFILPICYDAIDGKLSKPSVWWHEGGGARRCYRSHLNTFETCLNDRIESVLIIEDEAILVPDFAKRAQAFLKEVYDNWDMLYLGGQHLFQIRNP